MTSPTWKQIKHMLIFLVFPLVKFRESLYTSQYNFLTKFYLRIPFFNQKYEIILFLRILQINFSFLN